MSTVPLALTSYSISVAFHVIFVVVGFGASFAFPFIGMKAKESPQNMAFALDVMVAVQTKLLSPLSVLVLLTGLYQVADGPYSFSDGWLGLSFLIFIVYMGVVGGLMIPSTRRARDLAVESAGGPPPPELLEIVQRNAKLGPFLGLTIVLLTFLMEAKPF